MCKYRYIIENLEKLRCKKLIEVALPLDAINAASARFRMAQRGGHGSMRRPMTSIC